MKNFIFTLLMSSIATKHFLVQTEGKILVLYININPVSTETDISFSPEEKRKSEIPHRTGAPHSVSLHL